MKQAAKEFALLILGTIVLCAIGVGLQYLGQGNLNVIPPLFSVAGVGFHLMLGAGFSLVIELVFILAMLPALFLRKTSFNDWIKFAFSPHPKKEDRKKALTRRLLWAGTGIAAIWVVYYLQQNQLNQRQALGLLLALVFATLVLIFLAFAGDPALLGKSKTNWLNRIVTDPTPKGLFLIYFVIISFMIPFTTLFSLGQALFTTYFWKSNTTFSQELPGDFAQFKAVGPMFFVLFFVTSAIIWIQNRMNRRLASKHLR